MVSICPDLHYKYRFITLSIQRESFESKFRESSSFSQKEILVLILGILLRVFLILAR